MELVGAGDDDGELEDEDEDAGAGFGEARWAVQRWCWSLVVRALLP